jgi:hypothetical protein
VLQLWGTIIALVLEARVADGAITVPRATVAVDCGLAINPLGVAAQVESGVIFGLSAALHGEVTIKGGRVEQSNYHDYRILRLNEAPPSPRISSTAPPTPAAWANRPAPWWRRRWPMPCSPPAASGCAPCRWRWRWNGRPEPRYARSLVPSLFVI